MNFPFSLTFRNQTEVYGAKKLLEKITPSAKAEELGFLPGRYFVLFFENRDSAYEEMRKRVLSSLKTQG